MVTSSSAISQVTPFDQDAPKSAHRQIAQYAGASGTPTDHQDFCLEVSHIDFTYSTIDLL
jgi:hypothetical protein